MRDGGMKGTAREHDIASKVLKHGMTIKEAAFYHGIHMVVARQVLHNHCRRINATLYDKLKHSTKYADGYINSDCLPFLKELRAHGDDFLM